MITATQVHQTSREALAGRYADDPVGDYETTDGGW